MLLGPGLAAVRPERRGGGGVVAVSPAFEDDFEAYEVGLSSLSGQGWWEQGDGTSSIAGTGADGSFTRTSGAWTVNAYVGIDVYLGTTATGAELGPFTVTSNTADTLSFVGDATSGSMVYTQNQRPCISDAWSYSGSKSLEFRFGPDPSDSVASVSEADSRSEQGVTFSTPASEFWMEYRLKLGSNYTHRSQDGTGNNKFFGLFTDPWGSDLIADCEVYHDPGNAAGTSSLFPQLRKANGDLDIITSGEATTFVDPVVSASGPIIPGTACLVQYHVRTATSAAANNGLFEILIDGTHVLLVENYPVWYPTASDHYGDATAVFGDGYILGAANSGFADRTLIWVDDFKVYGSHPGWGS